MTGFTRRFTAMAGTWGSTWMLLAILAVAALVRLIDAMRSPLELIERDEFIPGAIGISWDHLPLRVAQHGALPIYLVRFSALMFGETALGMRVLSVFAGTATIVLLYLIAKRWWNTPAALTTAALLAVERYHRAVSARAIDLPYDLFFVALTLYAFSRFLYAVDRQPDVGRAGRWLYLTATASAMAFLCKELSALLLPALVSCLVLTGHAAWLRRRELWVAAALFVVIISPDLYSNLTVHESERVAMRDYHLSVARQLGTELLPEPYVNKGLYMSYGDQLSRFRAFGPTSEPFYFYFGDILDRLGISHVNGFDEFPYLHPLMGCALWAGVAVSVGRKNKDRLTVALLTIFFVTFLPFTFVQLGAPRDAFPSDPTQLFYWVDRSMLPALLLAAYSITSFVGWGRASESTKVSSGSRVQT